MALSMTEAIWRCFGTLDAEKAEFAGKFVPPGTGLGLVSFPEVGDCLGNGFFQSFQFTQRKRLEIDTGPSCLHVVPGR